jgi:propionyl-CoA carboxylase beta chain
MGGGRSFDADLSVAWPTAEICAMSIEGAVDVAYRREVQSAPDPAARRAELIARFRGQLGAVRAAEGFGIDDVIDPRDTRRLLVTAVWRAAGRRSADPRPRKRHGISPI